MLTFYYYLCFLSLFFYSQSVVALESVSIELSPKFIRKVRDDFVSLGMDSNLIRHKWCHIDWRKAIFYGQQLQPVTLRFGGNDADRMWFHTSERNEKEEFDVKRCSICGYFNGPNLSDDQPCLPRPMRKNFTVTTFQLDRLNWFSSATNWTLTFDLNALIRFPNGSYDVSNAHKLLNYASWKGYPMNFELGNEPNSFFHKFDYRVNGAQLAEDYRKLRYLLDSYPIFSNSSLIGPSVTNLGRKSASQRFLREFLHNDGWKWIDAITWHHYYINGRTAVVDDFVNSTILDSLKFGIKIALRYAKKYARKAEKQFPVWLGESASAWGGGAPNLSDSYVAGFMWMDKLGLAALNGIELVIRQSFYNGYYALIDKYSDPNPDYWLSLIFKRLVPNSVLNVRISTLNSSKIRFYAHCDSNKITVYGMNLKSNEVQLSFAHYPGTVLFYEFSPKRGRLTDKEVVINGIEPKFNSEGKFVLKNGKKIHQPLKIGAKRMVFIQMPLNGIKC